MPKAKKIQVEMAPDEWAMFLSFGRDLVMAIEQEDMPSQERIALARISNVLTKIAMQLDEALDDGQPSTH